MPFIYVRRKRRRSYSTYGRRSKRTRRVYRRRRRTSFRRRNRGPSVGRSRSSKSLYTDSYYAKVRAHVSGYLESPKELNSMFKVPGNYLPPLIGQGSMGSFIEGNTRQIKDLNKIYKWYRVYASKIYLRVWSNENDKAIVKVNLYPAMEAEEDSWNVQNNVSSTVDPRVLGDINYAKTATITPLLNTATANTVAAKSAALNHYMSTVKLYGDKSVNSYLGSAGVLSYSSGTPSIPSYDTRWSWYFSSGSMYDYEQWGVDGGWTQTRQVAVRIVYYVKFFGRRMPDPNPTFVDA